MSNIETIVKGRDFGDTLVPYDGQWVALHRRDDTVIESAATLPELMAKLRPEDLAAATFMQVLPHDVSFISWMHEIPIIENCPRGR